MQALMVAYGDRTFRSDLDAFPKPFCAYIGSSSALGEGIQKGKEGAAPVGVIEFSNPNEASPLSISRVELITSCISPFVVVAFLAI